MTLSSAAAGQRACWSQATRCAPAPLLCCPRQAARGSARPQGFLSGTRDGRLGVAAVHSAQESQTVSDRTPPPLPPEVEIKVIGFGGRGINAVNKLMQHGKVRGFGSKAVQSCSHCAPSICHVAKMQECGPPVLTARHCHPHPLPFYLSTHYVLHGPCLTLQVAATDAWCLDVDPAILEAACTTNTLLLPKDEPTPASAAGRLAAGDLQRLVGRTASDAGGRGNINAGTDGAVTFVLAPAAAPPGGPATLLQVVQALRAAGHLTVAAVTRPFEFEGTAKQEQVRTDCKQALLE